MTRITVEPYFVDRRGGCVAVRDRALTDPDYQGLHNDTPGVIAFWHGHTAHATCKHCGHRSMAGWDVDLADMDAAQHLCDKLNKEAADASDQG